MSERRIENGNGRVTAMTLITPIRPRVVWVQRLVFFLLRNVALLTDTLRQLAFVHFGWWAIIDRLPYDGPPQQPEDLRCRYLLFESNFDGPWKPYIDTFGLVLAQKVNMVWHWSFGFPGASPTGPAIRYVGENQLPVDHFYAAYPDASSKMVISALRLSERFSAFQSEVADLDTDDFAHAYQRFVRAAQREL